MRREIFEGVTYTNMQGRGGLRPPPRVGWGGRPGRPYLSTR